MMMVTDRKQHLLLTLCIATTFDLVAGRQSFDDLEWYRFIALGVIGVAVGFVGGFAGIGGAPFMVGLLRLFVKFCQHEAQGTVLAVMLPPMSLMSVLVMRDRAQVLWKICTPAFFGYAICSYGGAELAFLMDAKELTYVFGVFLVVLGVRYGKTFLLKLCTGKQASSAVAPASPKGEDSEIEVVDMEGELNPDGPTVKEGFPIPFNYVTSGVIGAIIGVVGGLFGVGAGVLMVPVFTELCGVHKDDARTLSLLILLPPVSAGAVVKYAQEDAIDWPMAGMLFALYFVSNFWGGKAGRTVSTATFKVLMGTMLAVLGGFIILGARYENPLGEDDCDE